MRKSDRTRNLFLAIVGISLAVVLGATMIRLLGDQSVDLPDAVHMLRYLFLEGPPPLLGTECVWIEGCPDVCGL